jgi:hypothetical protein
MVCSGDGGVRSGWGPPEGRKAGRVPPCAVGVTRAGRIPPRPLRSQRLTAPATPGTCVQVVAIVGPPFVVEQEGVLGVGRVGRHVRRHVDAQIGMLTHQRRRGRTRRAVGDVLRLIGQTLRVGREVSGSPSRGPDGPRADPSGMIQPSRSNTCASHSIATGWPCSSITAEEATVIGRAHDRLRHRPEAAACRRRRSTRSVSVLDGVELGEGRSDAFIGLQHVVDVFHGHAVTDQRPFHVVDRALFQRALAREVFQCRRRRRCRSAAPSHSSTSVR